MSHSEKNGFLPADYDNELVRLFPFILEPGHVESFSNRGIDLPTGMRRRMRAQVAKLLQDDIPLIDKAGMALKDGNVDEAEALYEECMKRAADKKDPRFFGVYWGLGTIRQGQGRSQEALELYKLAIVQYPGQYRKAHVLELQAVMTSAGISETDRAAIMNRGIVDLDAAGKDTEIPRQVFAGMETYPRKGEQRIGRGRINGFVG